MMRLCDFAYKLLDPFENVAHLSNPEIQKRQPDFSGLALVSIKRLESAYSLPV